MWVATRSSLMSSGVTCPFVSIEDRASGSTERVFTVQAGRPVRRRDDHSPYQELGSMLRLVRPEFSYVVKYEVIREICFLLLW